MGEYISQPSSEGSTSSSAKDPSDTLPNLLPPSSNSYTVLRSGSPEEQGNSADRILSLYKGLTYFDQYGGSVMLFILFTIVDLIAISYFHIMKDVAPIRADWGNQKCKPSVIPFAGFINAPPGTSAFDFTQENFSSCMQNILMSITGYMLEPLDFIVSSIEALYSLIVDAIQDIRTYIANIRFYIQSIAEQIISRILNIMVPIQQIIISFKDVTAKVNGVMIASLYSAMGYYDALVALIGTLLKLVIGVLVILGILVATLFSISWFFPPAAVIAMTTSAVLIAVSIPMAIIVVFMNDVMHTNAPRTWRR